MPTKIDPASPGSENLPSTGLSTVESDADKALNEIDAGADAATAALAEHDGTVVAADGETLVSKDSADYEANQAHQKQTERPKLSQEERRKIAIAKALKQQTVGAKALQKTFVGAVTLPYEVVINDVGIASSFVRFTALLDQALYTLGRYGQNAFSRGEINSVFDRFKTLIEQYSKDAKSNLEASSARLNQAKEALFDPNDWMQPSYQTHAQEIKLNVKHPLTKKFVEGMMNFDNALYGITVLEWNDAADPAEAARQRESERRQSRVIFYLAARTLIGLRKKTFEGLLDKRRKANDGGGEQSAAPADVEAVATTA